jgi:hypothetical protein
MFTFCFSPVSASLLYSFYSLENKTLSLAYFPPSHISFLYFSPYFSPVSLVSLSCCVLLGNNDRALCISRCKRNRTVVCAAKPKRAHTICGVCCQIKTCTHNLWCMLPNQNRSPGCGQHSSSALLKRRAVLIH